MKEKEDGKIPITRRSPEEDLDLDDDSILTISQSIDSLREGYAWIRVLELRYPGWHPLTVQGIPFVRLGKPLGECRVCLVSLAGVYRRGQKPFVTSAGMLSASLRAMKFKEQGDWSFREIPLDAETTDLLIAHAHYDTSEAEEDINCVFPMMRLLELEVEGFIGACSDVHFSLMGFVPEVHLIVGTAVKEILPRMQKHGVDVAIVCGGCELSHYSAALIQRELEAAGVATVAVSVCPDITERMQVPRAVLLRFPLGSPFGMSMDVPMHLRILRDALSLVETAQSPGQLKRLPYEWTKV